MSKKRRVKQDDRYRVVFTELMPFEVPMRLSSHKIYRMLSGEGFGTYPDKLFKGGRFKVDQDFIPYSFNIKYSDTKNRSLGLMHPLLFRDFCEFYERYADVITGLCKKSLWSMRAPVSVAKVYYVKRKGVNIEGVERDINGRPLERENQLQDFASSYFIYRDFDRLYKFFDSDELLSLEERFSCCRKFDVANCFGSVYTHSISWVVNTKEVAKSKAFRLAKQSFDSLFDSLIRRANHGETHGIIVGPEASRIFVEILLQQADLDVEQKLRRFDLAYGRDFVVRRYIDDYFVFYNKPGVANIVEQLLRSSLEPLKFVLNDSKAEEIRRPFVTQLSLAKRKLRQEIEAGLEFFVRGRPNKLNPDLSSSKLLNRIRYAVGESGALYPECSAYVLGELLRRLKAGIPSETLIASEGDAYVRWVNQIIDVSFHLAYVDRRFNVTMLITRLLLSAKEGLNFVPEHIARACLDCIVRRAIRLLDVICESRENGVEVVNFLIGLKSLGVAEEIPVSAVIDALGKYALFENSDYFAVVGLLYFASGCVAYDSTVEKVIKIAVQHIEDNNDVVFSTELFCLALDLCGCPNVPTSYKDRLVPLLMKHEAEKKLTGQNLRQAVNEFSRESWLFDWSATPTEEFLSKKELTSAY